MLAGGRSTRFGSDKLATIYRGVPLLHHAIASLAEVCIEVVVVIAPSMPEPPLPRGVTARIARDSTEGEGPLAGLYAGLLSTATEVALVAGGDMPNLATPVLVEMLRVAGDGAVEAVALEEAGGFRPLPCALRNGPAVDAGHTLLHAGRRSLRELLSGLRLVVIDEATWHAMDPELGTLRDVDVPGDLPS